MDVVTLGAALNGSKAYTDATIAPLLGGVHYRGSVNYFNNLPSNPAEGDAYTVKYSGTSGTSPDGTEYVWALDTDDNTYKWIGFSPDTYTKTEIDNLLSGKQPTIDSTHKLSSDLVDDSSSANKFATAAQLSQIETNKNNISAVTMGTQSTGNIDLNAVTTNSYKMYTNTTSNLPTSDGSWYFVKTTVFDNNTMLQEATAMNAGAKTYTRIKRSGNWQAWKLSNLDSTQEAAVNSGINDTLVGQINTNQNNISLLCDANGKKQLIPNFGILTNGSVTYTHNSDSTITITGSKGAGTENYVDIVQKSYEDYGLKSGDTIQVVNRDSAPVILAIIFTSSTSASSPNYTLNGTNTYTLPENYTGFRIRLSLTVSSTNVNVTINPLVCNKALYDISSAITPYSMSNAELTAKEQSNESNILSLEQMNGAKNKFNYYAWKNCGVFQGTKTVNGNSFTLVASGEDCFTYYENNEPRQYPINARIPCNAGDKVVLTWEYTPLSSQSDDRVGIFANGSTSTGFFALVSASNKKLEFTAPTGTTYLSIRFGVLTSGNSATYGNIQIQSKASYDAGFTDYQPYAMSNAELTAAIQAIQAQLANQ